jgi:hypothetical protein
MDIHPRKSWMWAEACALLEQAERKHRQFFDLLAAPPVPTALAARVQAPRRWKIP